MYQAQLPQRLDISRLEFRKVVFLEFELRTMRIKQEKQKKDKRYLRLNFISKYYVRRTISSKIGHLKLQFFFTLAKFVVKI